MGVSHLYPFGNPFRLFRYYVDILGTDYRGFDAAHYGTLLVVDPEEEFLREEVHKLEDDVKRLPSHPSHPQSHH